MKYTKGVKHALFEHRKTYGISKTIRAAYLYHIILIKRIFLKNKKNKIIVNGYEMNVNSNDKGISEELTMFKIHEPLNTKFLSKQLEEGMVCLDVGANLGYFAFLESSKIGKTGKVIAIEPAPLTFELFEQNIKLQKYQNISSYNFALSNKEGIIDFFVSDSSNWSRIIEGEDSDHGDKGSIIKIKCKTIDNFIDELKLNQLDLIRVDLEGYEFEIFECAQKTLSELKPMLQIEVHRDFMGIEKSLKFLKNMKDLGYEIEYYIPRGVDMPFVASIEDVKQVKLDYIIENIQNDPQMEYFTILLKNNT
jgi:FkbM family methyltransferase